MKTLTAALTSVGLLAMSTPAAAGWRTAQWGMSEAQLKKLYPGLSAPEKSETSGDMMMTMKDVTFAGIEWYSVYFVLDGSGKLSRVQLMSHDKRFPYIEDQIASQMGAPVLKEPHKAVFSDVKHHNSVKIVDDDLFGIFLTYSKPSERF